jgi:hypothetical protein
VTPPRRVAPFTAASRAVHRGESSFSTR